MYYLVNVYLVSYLLISFVQYLYNYLFSLEVFKNTLVDRKMEQGLLLNMHFKYDL